MDEKNLPTRPRYGSVDSVLYNNNNNKHVYILTQQLIVRTVFYLFEILCLAVEADNDNLHYIRADKAVRKNDTHATKGLFLDEDY